MRARARSYRWLNALSDDRLDIRQGGAADRVVDRIQTHTPERRVGGIHDEAPQSILGVFRSGRRANQIFAPLSDLGLRLKQIERRGLPDIHARLVLAHKGMRKLERALLNTHVRERRFECPVGLLHRRDRLDAGLTKTELRALLVSGRDDVLLACLRPSSGLSAAAAKTRA